MDKNLQNLDQRYQDAFGGGYEAPHSPSDIQADWSRISAQLPQAPLAQPPVKAPVWGAGKVLSIAGAAAVVTTAAVFLYNSLVKEPAVADNKANTPVAQQKANTPSNDPTTDNTASENQGIDWSKVKDYKVENKGIVGDFPIDRSIPTPKWSWDEKQDNGDLKQDTDATGGEGQGHDIGSFADPKQDEPQNNTNKVLPAPRDVYFTDSIICTGGQISVNNYSSKPADKIILEWGDGQWTSFGRTQEHTYNNPGKYTVKILYGDEVIKKVITVVKIPTLTFTTRCEGSKCTFRNMSETDLNWQWDFGDGTPVRAGYSQEHQYRDTGKYNVTLSGVTRGGCTTTITKLVYVKPAPVVPNVITPNGDGFNDKLVVDINGETYYSLVIYSTVDNREVFRTTDKNVHWDGKSGGQLCKPGTYWYVLQYKYQGENELKQEKDFFYIKE